MCHALEDFYAQKTTLRELSQHSILRRALYRGQRVLYAEQRNVWRQILGKPEPEAVKRLKAQLLNISGQLLAARLELKALLAQTMELQNAYTLRRQTGFGCGF